MARPKGSGNKAPEARAFVERVERQLKREGHTHGLEGFARRFITGEDTKVAFGVWAKLMEYKFGKAAERIEHTGTVNVEMSVADADSLIAGYFAITASRTNQIGSGDTGQTQEQTDNLLPI